MRSIAIHLFFVLIVFSAFNCYAKNVAVIVGVSEFAVQEVKENDMNLPAVYNDAELMCETLSNISSEQFEIHRVYALRKDVPNWNDANVPDSEKKVTAIDGTANYLPTKANILSTIATALTGLDKNDSILIYISSHGMVANNEEDAVKLLACDTTNDNQDYIQPKRDIRDGLLKNNPTGHKLLILDACGAGGTRSMFVSKFRSDILSDGISDVITLASCAITQESETMNNNTLSLYTYWLVCGLKGYADTSPKDGNISTNELIEYIKTNMQIKGTEQSPTAIYEQNKTKHFTVIKPQFKNQEEALDDLAEQIAVQLQIRELSDVSVADVMMSDDDIKSSNSPDYNSFLSYQTNYCSKELKKLIEAKCKPNNIVVKSMGSKTESSATVYIRLHCTPDSQNPKSIDNYEDSQNPKSIDNYELQCKIETASVPAEFSVRFSMSKTEQQLVNNNNNSANTTPSTTVPYKQLNALEFQTAQEQVAQVQFFVNGKQRPLYQIENVHYLPLNKGDKYEIKIVNKLGHNLAGEPIVLDDSMKDNPIYASTTLMGRILVDGKNTLPQKPEVRQTISKVLVSTNDKNEKVQYGATKLRIAGNQTITSPAPALGPTSVPESESVPEPEIETRIGKARPWVFNTNGTYPIKGFYKANANGTIQGYNEFVVDEVADNVKPEEYNPDTGLITIALYRARVRDRVITIEGDFHNQNLDESDARIGEQIGVIQIRYATEEAIYNIIQELSKPQNKPGTMRNF